MNELTNEQKRLLIDKLSNTVCVVCGKRYAKFSVWFYRHLKGHEVR